MNANDLLELIGKTRDSYILEAAEAQPQVKGLRRNHMALIAAIAAVMLLLAGCVAVYLRMQDMAIGQETYTQQLDEQGHLVEPTEKVRDILTLYGHSGSPIQLAAKEWYEFTQSYDPGELTNDPDLPEIPNNYEYIYDCYDQTMMDKLDEIVDKYGLKLLQERFPIQRWSTDIAMEGMNLPSLYRPEVPLEAQPVQGMIHSPGNFRLYIGFTLTGEDALWDKPVSGYMRYSRKDYFPEPLYSSFEEENYEQWTYTAADGTRLLLALNNTGYGYIIADLPDATIDITLSISLNHQMYDEIEAPTREVLEQMADIFDYSIRPEITDPDSLREALAAADEAEMAQDNYEAPSYDGFDGFMEESAVRLRESYYTFYDVDGDGQEDMLVGTSQGFFSTVLLRQGDTIQEYGTACFCLLESGQLSTYNPEEMGPDSTFLIYAPYSDQQLFRFGEDGTFLVPGETLWQFQKQEDTWYMWDMQVVTNLEEGPKTAVDIQQVLEDNPVMPLTWHACLDYPLSSGLTLAQYLESIDIPLPEEQLIAEYAAWVKEKERHSDYARYCLRDINGDGITDLLLSGDGLADLDPISATFYWSALTWRYGQLMSLDAHDFYLCEDGILEYYNWGYAFVTPDSPPGRKEHHKFFRLEDSEQVVLDYVIYYRATDSWVSGWDESPLTAEEAQAILDKYPRIDQGMRPIGELTGE